MIYFIYSNVKDKTILQIYGNTKKQKGTDYGIYQRF